MAHSYAGVVKRNRPPHAWIIPTLGVVILLGGTYVAWTYWASRVPSLDSAPPDLVRFIASDSFKKLPEDEQNKYINAVRPHFVSLYFDKSLSDEDKEMAYINAMLPRMNKELDQYFKLPAGAARDAYIDKTRAKRKPSTRPATPSRLTNSSGTGPPSGAGGMTPARVKRFVENAPPDRRAQMAEYFSDIQRRESR
jgi:hypothetical protein